MDKVAQLVVIAMIGEAVWESLKLLWQEGKISVDRVGALIVGLLLAIGTQFDLLAIVEIPVFIPYLGVVLTGILISRGAGFIHDIIGSVGTIYQQLKHNNQ